MDQNPIHIPPIAINNHQGKSLLDTPKLTIPNGAILAITGPSGAGKSLFLKTLFGWSNVSIPPVLHPSRGHLLIIQDPSQGLTPGLSLTGHFREVDPAPQWRDRAINLLRDLDLNSEDMLTRKPGAFSGGERQRIMVALTLTKKPSILVCDEPAASLDADNEARLWELLLKHKGDMTLIFVTHQMKLIETWADRVLLFHNGEIAFNGSRDAFFSQTNHPSHAALIATYKADPLPEVETHSMGQPAIEVQDLALSFGERVIFRQFSWRALEGEWWWFIGPSGAGKTSLAKMIAGLAIPDSGQILHRGKTLEPSLRKRDPQTRRNIQYVYQYGSKALNPALTVADQLKRAYGARTPELTTYLKALRLDAVNLNKKPGTFSLGEIQRLNLLRAIAAEPDILICDELLTSLDLVLQVEIMKFLCDRQRESGMTVLVITHDESLRRWKQGRVLDVGAMAG